ncbi:MAG: GntR family transcriptional regulator [Desulfobacterales bacterium]|nr:MAG: GntR family transcriptional regulator [Desulfobacterales bacterium]
MNLNPLKPIKHLSLKETAYENILKAITSGRFPPGSQITLSDLAQQLGVSLMPVREAVRKLEAGNLIHVRKNRRIIIKEYTPDELNELLQIRLKLELMATRKAVKNCTDETVKELERIQAEMNSAKDIEDYFEKNWIFHHTIYQTANMPILEGIIKELWLRVSPFLHIYIAEVPNYKSYTKRTHGGMIRGLKKRNAKEVCKYLSLDLRHAADLTTSLLKKRKNIT